MKVKELIKILQSVKPDADIYAWHDGDVHELHEISDCLDASDDGNNVQINIKNSMEYINES